MSTGRKKSFLEEMQEEKKSSKMKTRQGSPLSAEREKDGRVLSPEQYQPRVSNGAETEMIFSDSASYRLAESNHESSFYRETEGAMRDKFIVDINMMDGEPFKGTVSRTEALKNIFVKALGFSSAEFHGATPAFKGHPVVIFKTKEVFNIDERLAGKSHFVYQKKVKTEQGERLVEMSCTIKGIREKDPSKKEESIYTWLKIEGAEYQLKEDQIRVWLSEYGFLVSGITEDTEDVEGQSSEDEEIRNDVDINTGIYSAKVKLNKSIPQLIPMHGKKIKIYHKGIKKQCVNCYETGHFKKDCAKERKEWLDYVDGFMLASLLPEEYYGNWIKLVEDWRSKNPEKHAQNRVDKEEDARKQVEARGRREEDIKQIARILKEQRLSSDNKRTSGGEGNENPNERSQQSKQSMNQEEQVADRERESEIVDKEDKEATSEQPDQTFAKPTGKKVATKAAKKSNTRGKGRGKGGSQSLHSSPTNTPSNGRSNE